MLRLLLWEAMEVGDEPVSGEEERREAYRENVRGLVESGVGAAPARRRAAVIEAVRTLAQSRPEAESADAPAPAPRFAADQRAWSDPPSALCP